MGEFSKKPSPEFLSEMQQDAWLLNNALDNKVVSKETVLKTELRQAHEARVRAVRFVQDGLSHTLHALREKLKKAESPEAADAIQRKIFRVYQDLKNLVSDDARKVADMCLKYAYYFRQKMETTLGEEKGKDARLDHAREVLVNLIKKSIQEFNADQRRGAKLTKSAEPVYAIEAVLFIGSRAEPKKTPREESDVDIVVIDSHRTKEEQWEEFLNRLENELNKKSLSLHHARNEPIRWEQILALAELKNKSLLPLTELIDSATVIIAKNKTVEALLKHCSTFDRKRYHYEPLKTYL